MTSGAIEKVQPAQIREFAIGVDNQTTVQQRGRVSRLSNPQFGVTYLIDITDREDPTTKEDPEDPGEKGELVEALLKKRLDDPEINDMVANNNGVIAVITDKLDPQKRKRVYGRTYS